MPRKPQEIQKQNEEEKQSNNNQKYRYIKRNENKLTSKENQNQFFENNQNQNNNYQKENINTKKRSFVNDSRQNNFINNNKNEENLKKNEEEENNENLNNNPNSENLLDSETYIVDNEDSIEKPPNAIEINDLLGEKCKIEMDILSINFTNFEQSKTSSKSMGVVKAYGANTYQGLVRNYNEDRVSIIINMAKPKNYPKKYWPKTSFFGIYDGHGGSMCAEFLRDCLHKLILNDPNFPENVELAIKNGFFNAEKNFLNEIALDPNDTNIISDRSGSCAVVVLIVDKKIYVANVGDSRALFSEKKGINFVVVTDDHKPNNPNEKNRIIKNGGHVYQSRTVISGAENENLNGQILFGPYRVLPGRLSVSRTIGDIEAKSETFGGNPNVIIWEPDIFIYDLNKNDIDFFIMGCDGIFDQMSNQEVMECAWMILNNEPNNNKENESENNNEESFEYNFENVNIHEKCGLIVDFIIKSSMVRKSFDNVTCLMIAFNDFIPKEKDEKKLNSISTEEYLKNIYRLNNSVNNQVKAQNKKSNKILNNIDNQRKSENDNHIYNSGIISNPHNKNITNKINTNNSSKDMPKNFLKPNLKLTNFINTKTTVPNNSNDFLPKTYRNTDSSIVAKKNNYNINTMNNISNNNKVYIKKRKERNPPKKSVNKTDINNNNEENLSKSNIATKKMVNKIDVQEVRRSTANNISIQRLSNNQQGKKKRINTGNNINSSKLDGSQSQNELLNNIYSPNKSKNDTNINNNISNNINNNIIQKLKQNKIAKMPLELNNKLINSNNPNNNSLNVHFYYSNTYSTKYKKLPYLKTNSISNIPSLTSNTNHLTTTNVTLNSINTQMRPKKIKNLTKPKTFRYNNNTSLNKYRKTFYKNNFFGNGSKPNYNHYSHNINNISNNNNIISHHNNIVYSQNFNVKIKSRKGRETITSRKKKNSFHKVIKSLGLNNENGVKNNVKQLSSKKLSYSKEKDIKNFLYKNKTNIVSAQNDNISGNKKYTKKNNYKDNIKY